MNKLFPEQYELLNHYLHPLDKLSHDLVGQDEILFSLEAAIYKKDMSNVELIAEAGQGKRLSDKTLIPIYDKYDANKIFKPNGLLEVGDYVYDEHGKPTKVTGIYNKDTARSFSINFSGNKQLICDPEHLFTWKYRDSKEWHTNTVEELNQLNLKNKNDKYQIEIPINKPIERVGFHKPAYLNPYVYGNYISKVNNTDDFVINGTNLKAMKFIMDELNMGIPIVSNKSKICKIELSTTKHLKTKDVSDLLETITDEETKSIESVYKGGSINQREELIQGIFDELGSVDDTTGYISLKSKSKVFLKDIQEILGTLGILSEIIENTLTIKGLEHKNLNVFKFSHNYNKITRMLHKLPINKQHCYITSIEDLHTYEPMTCIMVESDSHLYLAAENPVVTHNTAITQKFAENNKDRLNVFEVSLSQLHGEDQNLGVRLDKLFDELIDYKEHYKSDKETVLFFDELHQLPMFSPAAVEAIKPKLARGAQLGIHIIGATTYLEHIKYIKENTALTTRFQQLHVPELSRESVHKILLNQFTSYGFKPNAKTDKLLYDIIDYSNLALPTESQPRKSRDILDTMYGRYSASKRHKLNVNFDSNLLSDVLYQKSHYRLNFKVNTLDIEKQLNNEVFDQLASASILSDYAYASVLNVQSKDQPRGKFLLVGPTGVGKTESVKAFTRILFGNDAKIASFDMGEYQTKESVPRFQERIANTVLTAGTPVILLDEIEKAHPDVSTLLYSILDSAVISDKYGQTVSFVNSFIFMTTNIGEDTLGEYSDRGLTADDLSETIKTIDKTIRSDLQNAVNFPQAFLGRLSAIIPFLPLPDETMGKIAKRNLFKMKATIEEAQPVKLKLDLDQLVTFIISEKTDMSSNAGGARQIKNIVEQQVRNKIAKPIAINPTLNRFNVTMAGETKTGDAKRLHSKAYIEVTGRSVDMVKINSYISTIITKFKQQNIVLKFNMNEFYEFFTVDPINYTVSTNKRIDQTDICLSKIQNWYKDLSNTIQVNKDTKVSRVDCKFTRSEKTGKPYQFLFY